MRPKRYTRFIRKAVREKLLGDSRGRCCLARHTYIPGERRVEAIPGRLHQHHLIYYSDGGPPTADNLTVVCPNCHELIHADPDIYTIERLKAEKDRWVGAKGVVPSRLSYSSPPAVPVVHVVELLFLLESLNLQYLIEVPTAIVTGQLAGFIRDTIIAPLGHYLGRDEWVEGNEIELALQSNPEMPLPLLTPAAEIAARSDATLVARLQAWVVPR